MFEQLGRRNRPDRVHRRPHTSHGPVMMVDAELIRLCAEFQRDHLTWTSRFSDDMFEQPDILAEMSGLRSAWKSALHRIRHLTPASLDGARAKLSAALMFADWSAPGEGYAADFLSVAVTELKPFLCSSGSAVREQDLPESASTARPMQWLDRFARRAGLTSDRQGRGGEKNISRSQN